MEAHEEMGGRGVRRRGGGRRSLSFAQSVVFQAVMEDEGICRRVAEAALGLRIERVERSSVEMPVSPGPRARGVRVDAFLKGDGRVIDVEMQARPVPMLARRLRYYQAALDVREARREGPGYASLPESAIAFICLFDPLGLGLPRYEVRPCIINAGGRPAVDAGARWVLLNARAWEAERDPALRELLSYVINGACGAAPGTLAGDIDAAVARLEADDEWMVRNMEGLFDYWEMQEMEREAWRVEAEQAKAKAVAEAVAEGEAKGLAEGEAKGLAEGRAQIAARLAELGVSPDIIARACEAPA